MTRRQTADYAAVLKVIKPLMPSLKCFMLDFEKQLWSAVRIVFPEINIKGCGFHYAQAIYKNMRDCGLEVRNDFCVLKSCTYCTYKNRYSCKICITTIENENMNKLNV